MKLGVLFSGGKDSFLAAFLASKKEEISCLIAIISKNKESYMFHTPNIELTKIQAEALNLPLIRMETTGNKEVELKDLKKAILLAKTNHKIEGIVTGAVASTYQSSRIQKICNELNLHCFNPLWQKPQLELLEDLTKNKIHAIITQIAAEGFNKKWLGRRIDKKAIEDLKNLNKKYGINMLGDDGGYESLVLYGPLFKKKIQIKTVAISQSSEYGGIYDIKSVALGTIPRKR